MLEVYRPLSGLLVALPHAGSQESDEPALLLKLSQLLLELVASVTGGLGVVRCAREQAQTTSRYGSIIKVYLRYTLVSVKHIEHHRNLTPKLL